MIRSLKHKSDNIFSLLFELQIQMEQSNLQGTFMFTGRVSDCVHGKGQHQLGLGGRSLKGVPLSQLICTSTDYKIVRLSCNQLCSRALKLG